MKYQDQKIKSIGRLSIMMTVGTILLALSLIYPDHTRSIVQHLPLSRNGNEYIVWIGVLAILVPIFLSVNLALIFTSPEQESRFVRWSKRWRKAPIEFENVEFDTLDPDYRKVTWRYFLERRQR